MGKSCLLRDMAYDESFQEYSTISFLKKPQNLTKNMDRKRLDTVPFLSLIGNNTPPAIFPETWKCKLQTISKRDARLDATL